MLIKIKTQEDVGLIDCTYKDILITGAGYKTIAAISENGRAQTLGIYKDTEEALKVLKTIETAIEFQQNADILTKNFNSILIIKMPEEGEIENDIRKQESSTI